MDSMLNQLKEYFFNRFPFIEQKDLIIIITVLVVALLYVFFGYKLLRVYISLLGLLLGAVIGIVICAVLDLSSLTAVLIIVLQTVWSPFLLNRYCEDFLWLLAILVFFVAGFRTRAAEKPSNYAGFVCWLSVLSLFIGLLIILIPEEASLTVTRPELLDRLLHMVTLGAC